MSPSNVKIDEKIFDTYKELIKQVKDIKSDLIKSAEEIEDLFASVCQKIARQEVQSNLRRLIQFCENFHYEDYEKEWSSIEIKNVQLEEMQALKSNAMELIKNIESSFNSK